MVTLTERTIMKSRSGVYSDTSENRRKHRVGQKYGAEKQPDIDDGSSIPDTLINKFDSKDKIAIKRAIADSKKDGKIRYVFSSPDGDIGISTNSNGMGDELLFTIGKEKTEKKESDPVKELEAVNKVITAINEGKLNLPAAEVMKLSEKKQKLEAAKKQAEKINSGVKANEEKKNAEEAKETSKKINEAQKKEAPKEKASKSEVASDGKSIQKRKVELLDKYHEDLEKMNKAYEQGQDRIMKELDDEVDNKTRKELWTSLKEKTNNHNEATNKLWKEYESNLDKLEKEEDTHYDKLSEKEKDEVNLKEETEVYPRVKFDDVPNSGKVNLKKYLTDKVRKGVDEKWSSIKKIPTENLKKMEKGLVNDLNKNFEAIKKSQRAELLYSIMKVRGELESRGKETQKKE